MNKQPAKKTPMPLPMRGSRTAKHKAAKKK